MSGAHCPTCTCCHEPRAMKFCHTCRLPFMDRDLVEHRPEICSECAGGHLVLCAYQLDGEERLEVPCPDHDSLERLPAALRYGGIVYGRTGWNSDRAIAYYSSARKVALAT